MYVSKKQELRAFLATYRPKRAVALNILDYVIGQKFRIAGDVVPFKPSGPTKTIGGRKYALSDYWAMFDGADQSLGGAKLIKPDGQERRHSFLWVYNVDNKDLCMWRVSDGSFKVDMRASQAAAEIAILDKRKQLNRVTSREFRVIEQAMRDQEHETLAHLKAYLEENADEWDKLTKSMAEELFNRQYLPKILAKFDEIERGVMPFSFKPDLDRIEQRSIQDQAKMHVAIKILEDWNTKTFEDYLETKGYDTRNPPGGIQAAQWAAQDVLDEFYDKYFPHAGG